MTNKRSSEIWADENLKISLEKVIFGKFSTEPEVFLGNREENLKQRDKCVIASAGMDAAALNYTSMSLSASI